MNKIQFIYFYLWFYKIKSIIEKYFVRSGIWTHALRRGLRPERSALDHSAILTWYLLWEI